MIIYRNIIGLLIIFAKLYISQFNFNQRTTFETASIIDLLDTVSILDISFSILSI